MLQLNSPVAPFHSSGSKEIEPNEYRQEVVNCFEFGGSVGTDADLGRRACAHCGMLVVIERNRVIADSATAFVA